MHEMGICQSILATAIEAAEKQGAQRINEIRISVGELTEIVEFALQFAFETLREETIARDAVLVVQHVPAKSRCPQCGTEFEHGRFDAICPKCENPFNEPIQGRELRIDSIDIDESHAASGADDSQAADLGG